MNEKARIMIPKECSQLAHRSKKMAEQDEGLRKILKEFATSCVSQWYKSSYLTFEGAAVDEIRKLGYTRPADPAERVEARAIRFYKILAIMDRYFEAKRKAFSNREGFAPSPYAEEILSLLSPVLELTPMEIHHIQNALLHEYKDEWCSICEDICVKLGIEIRPDDIDTLKGKR